MALALAEGMRKLTGARLGIGVTGIAGPGGGTPEKPVGLVYIGIADERGPRQKEFRFLGDRDRIRLFASQAALDMARRYFLAPSRPELSRAAFRRARSARSSARRRLRELIERLETRVPGRSLGAARKEFTSR